MNASAKRRSVEAGIDQGDDTNLDQSDLPFPVRKKGAKTQGPKVVNRAADATTEVVVQDNEIVVETESKTE
jgi:hypothetical protein